MKRAIKVLADDEFYSYIGPPGSLSAHRAKKIVHSHDGATPGGLPSSGLTSLPPDDGRIYGIYRGRWTPIEAVEKDHTGAGPGPQELIAGDQSAGYFGEVAIEEFITGDRLALEIGLSKGTPQNNDEPWFKFILNGKILFVAKKTLRSGISWEDIYLTGAVYGDGTFGLNPPGVSVPQTATVQIGGRNYKVRLLRGANRDPYEYSVYNVNAPPGVELSEWDRLIIQLTNGAFADYPLSDIGVLSGTDNATAPYSTMCVETHPHGGQQNHRLFRGYGGDVSRLGAVDYNIAGSIWRPVLELIQ